MKERVRVGEDTAGRTFRETRRAAQQVVYRSEELQHGSVAHVGVPIVTVHCVEFT